MCLDSAQLVNQDGAVGKGGVGRVGDQSQRGSAGDGQGRGIGEQYRFSAGGNGVGRQGARDKGAVGIELYTGQRGGVRRSRVDRVVHLIAARLGEDEVTGAGRMGDLGPQNHLVGGEGKGRAGGGRRLSRRSNGVEGLRRWRGSGGTGRTDGAGRAVYLCTTLDFPLC